MCIRDRDYNVSLSGGGDSGSYFVSAGYYNNDGVSYGNTFDRYSFRVNTQGDVYKRQRILKIHILPPFYLSGWAYFIYLLLGILSVVGILSLIHISGKTGVECLSCI